MGERTWTEKIVSLCAVSLCIYLFYATVWGPYKTTIVHRAIFLAAMMVIFFWSTKPLGRGRLGVSIDKALVFLTTLALAYVVFFWESILEAIGGTYMSLTQILVAFIILFAVLEAVRRISLVLLMMAVAAIAYILWGDYLPGDFSHAGMEFKRFLYLTAYSHEGIFGIGLAVSSTYLFMFMLLSVVIQETGASDFFLNFTHSLIGKARGGPAKCAVIGSGLTGTFIGSSIGNVVTTGAITIPMMKKSGYRPHVAGAIEVVSSEGAQLVPPVMGAGAFIMAELTGIPYRTIALSAIIPALLYYLSLYIYVDVEAQRMKISGLERVEKAPRVLREGGHYLIPIGVLFYLLLVASFTVTFAGLITVIAALAVNEFRKKTRIDFRKLYSLLDGGTRKSAELTALIAVIGIIQSAFTITGLGPRLSELLVASAGGNPLFVLTMGMALSLLLGMGMPTPIAYLLTAVFVAPALEEVGFSRLGAHMFLFFFAIKSGSTPPVAVVAVVAAGIAAANWWKTAWQSFVYSLPGFFIAYAFVYYPAYLAEGGWTHILTALGCGLIGTAGVTYGFKRYLLIPLALWETLFLFAGSLITIFTGGANLLWGLILIAPVGFSQWRKWRQEEVGRGPA